MKVKLGAFLGGAVFGLGLAIAGMTQPAKIVGFFDFFGSWDPSLAFVMLGATAVYAPVYRWAVRTWQRPIWAPAFSLPTLEDIDAKLIVGSTEALTFGAAMLVGVGAYQLFMRIREGRSGGPVDPQAAAMIDG
jgi:uncharacterized membrane protein YedE/YeeE